MSGFDTAARQIARLVGWAIDESLAKLFPPPRHLRMTSDQLLNYLTDLEAEREVLEPGDCDCILGSPTPWSHEDHCPDPGDCPLDPPAGAARTQPPQPPVDGTGGRYHDELTWVLSVVLRRYLSKDLGINGAAVPVIAKAAAAELLAHFDVERRP